MSADEYRVVEYNRLGHAAVIAPTGRTVKVAYTAAEAAEWAERKVRT